MLKGKLAAASKKLLKKLVMPNLFFCKAEAPSKISRSATDNYMHGVKIIGPKITHLLFFPTKELLVANGNINMHLLEDFIVASLISNYVQLTFHTKLAL